MNRLTDGIPTTDPVPVAYSQNSKLCSWVSYPTRCRLWGDARYRGNCDGTLFKELVQWYRPRSVADPMVGSGTTADVMLGLRNLGLFRGRFWASDLKRGFNLLTTPLPGRFDFIWVHPPYWNIIRYSDDAADISTMPTFEGFLHGLRVCLSRCFEALNEGGRLAVLVGDVRRRGSYYCLGRAVMNMTGLIGELRSVIIKAQHNCTSDTRLYRTQEDVPIKHEYCLIFKRQ